MTIDVKIPKSQRLFTLEEVATHCTKEDAWTIVNDRIYDLTKYTTQEIHPGGEVIFSHAGGDSTDAFTVHHPEYVFKKKLCKYQIGIVSNPAPVPQIVKEYREIFKKVEKEGYYETDWLYYGWKFTYPFLFFAMALFMLYRGGDNYLSVFIAAVCVGMFQHQGAFIAHDASHQGISHNWTVDFILSEIYGTMIFGISTLWWKYTHNQHHVVVNEYDIDPDITHIPFFAVNKMMFLSDKSKDGNMLTRILLGIQHFTFFPILLIFARISMYFQSLIMLFIKRGVPTMPWQDLHLPAMWNWMDRISQLIYFTWMYYVFTLIPPGKFWLFFIVQHVIVGMLFLHLTLNHWDRPTKHSSEEKDNWFVKQVVTGRNQDCDWTNDWLLGGLHFQIEHHILPRLPRHNLVKFKENYVVPFCKKWDIPYASSGFWHCAMDVVFNLEDVSKHVHDERIHKNTTKHKIFPSLIE